MIAYLHKHTYIFMLRIYICNNLEKWVYYKLKGGIKMRKKLFLSVLITLMATT